MTILTFMSWNVTGIMTSASYLTDCLSKYSIDFCGLAEHWLYEHNLHFLDRIHTSYSSHAVSDSNLYQGDTRKVGKGGVAILWNKRFDGMVSCLPIDSDRIIGIQIELCKNYFLYLFQMYLPSKNNRVDVFNDCLESLNALIDAYSDKGDI